MSPAQKTFNMVVASFVAGVSAMALVGVVATVAVKGGLEVYAAEASVVERGAAPIQPLDITAVRSQLASAEQSMAVTRSKTERAMTRLERLSGR